MSPNTFLIGSHDRQLEDLLRGIFPEGISTGGVEVLGGSRASSARPKVIVVDLRHELSVAASLATIRRSHPTAGILVVAATMDPAMMLDAMRAGVTEFLAEPIADADLRAALGRVTSIAAPVATGRVYAFVGAKGGVGTTTVAVNVATALRAAAKARVLLVDLHPAYGDAALFFGAEPRFSVLDALENTHRLDDAYLKGLVQHTASGVDLLASSDRAMVMPIDPERVRALIEFVRGCYAHVVLDVPRSDSAILDSLGSAHNIVVVANQELSTVRGAARMATALRQRYGKEHVQVVVSRYDTVSEIGHEDIERVTGGSVKHVFPSNYRLAVDALNKGRPLVVENHNKLAASFVGFAKALSGVKTAAPPADEKSGGLFGRLTGRR